MSEWKFPAYEKFTGLNSGQENVKHVLVLLTIYKAEIYIYYKAKINQVQ